MILRFRLSTMSLLASGGKQRGKGGKVQDEVGNWVVNRVKLAQYENAFKNTFKDASLSEISTITSQNFEKGIIQMMGGDKKANFGHLAKFTKAHVELRKSNGT